MNFLNGFQWISMIIIVITIIVFLMWLCILPFELWNEHKYLESILVCVDDIVVASLIVGFSIQDNKIMEE